MAGFARGLDPGARGERIRKPPHRDLVARPPRLTTATRLAILGTGKIGESLLAGLLSSGWTDVVATARRQERVDELRERYGVEATL